MSVEVKRLSMLEILNETIQFYSEDTNRRAVNAETTYCEYNTEDGRHCAVGRCLLPEFQEEGINLDGNVGASPDTLGNRNGFHVFDNMLQEQYRGLQLSFWGQLQVLHDGDRFWTDGGLSELGKEKVKDIKERFGIVV